MIFMFFFIRCSFSIFKVAHRQHLLTLLHCANFTIDDFFLRKSNKKRIPENPWISPIEPRDRFVHIKSIEKWSYRPVVADGKFHLLPTGELLVHSLEFSDQFLSYKCRTMHRLTRQVVVSSPANIRIEGTVFNLQGIIDDCDNVVCRR